LTNPLLDSSPTQTLPHIDPALHLFDITQVGFFFGIPLAKMRIAVVSTLNECVPPKNYGGSERVVHFLVEELVALGHSVTLYAPRDSQTSAKLVECIGEPFREYNDEKFDLLEKQTRRVIADKDNYDIIHFHHETWPFHKHVLTSPGPYVWTDHRRLDLPGTPAMLKQLHEAAGIALVSISDSQRRPITDTPFAATIYNCMPPDLLKPLPVPSRDYLAFVGRFSPEKGVVEAINIATRANMKLKLAGVLDCSHHDYYENELKPLLASRDNVDWIGAIGCEEKSAFLSGAIALLFPILWEEPFGMVLIEAMACGTPVIAFDRGAVREILEDGVTGFVVKDEKEAVEKMKLVGSLDKERIREEFVKRFSARKMVGDHVKVYEEVIKRGKKTISTGVRKDSGVELGSDSDNEVLRDFGNGESTDS